MNGFFRKVKKTNEEAVTHCEALEGLYSFFLLMSASVRHSLRVSSGSLVSSVMTGLSPAEVPPLKQVCHIHLTQDDWPYQFTRSHS